MWVPIPMTPLEARACPRIISIPAAAKRLQSPVVLAPDQCRSLLDDLANIADPRKRRGRRHALGAVLAVAVAAVLAGARSLAAIGEWAADAPQPVLAALGVRPDPLRRVWRPPGEATVRRVLARVDPDALDLAIGRWLADQQPPPPATRPPPRPAWRQAVAVDGKTLRGSGHHQTAPVHLLAAMDHTSRAVLAQTDVDTKTNEITQFQPLQQRCEGGDLFGCAADLALGQHRAGGVVHRRQQVHRCGLVVAPWAPRNVLPSTATARRRAWSWRSRSASQAPIAVARASASRRARVRRMVASAGTPKQPGACWRAPRAARTGWGASAAHSAIAVIDRAPASTAAAASPKIASSEWRRPRAARGSGTRARQASRRGASVSWSWRGSVRASWVSAAGIGDDSSAGTGVRPGHEAVRTA
jgi:DDE_Tnp_1-associated